MFWFFGIFRCFDFVRRRSRYFMSINHLPKIRLHESVPAREPTLQMHVTTAKHFVACCFVRGSNNCAFVCAAYMTDVVSHQTDGIPEAIYVDGEEHRKWFCDCLLQATLVLCPRINEHRTTFLIITPPLSEFICSS